KRIYSGLSRSEASILTQLRNSHANLNGHPHHINAADSPDCNACNIPETVSHFLLSCCKYADAHQTL
ncbi:hypothetical protein IW261DRAFT_1338403, partial [Armillaria novae-zelandiae]